MSFLVLALSCMPCADVHNITKGDKVTSELSQLVFDSHCDHADACSPFCHCVCCSVHLTAQDNSLLYTITTPFSSKDFEPLADDNNLIERAFPVWQPPQLV